MIARLERDTSGRELKRLQGHVETETAYDPQGRLQRQQAINRQTRDTLIDRQYGYDNEGRINLIKDITRGETRFTYDPLDRLKRVTGNLDELFAFDPAGNILDREQRPEGGYVKGNRLQLLGDRHYEYDAAGNLVRECRGKNGGRVTEFEYSADNQLVAVTREGSRTEYAYDALGRRVSKTGEAQKTVFYWNGDVLLSEHTQGEETETKKTYLFEPYSFRPLAVEQDGRLYHYHLDHLGTPQELTDAQGNLAWQAHYKTYGNVALKPVETIENNLRFQGQYYDAESALHYNRNRYYDPEAGRFVHQDPIGLLGGENNYRYTKNPIEWVDRLGLTAKPGDCKSTVFAGHGAATTKTFEVPHGTSLTIYSEPGASISDDLGVSIEQGQLPTGIFKRTYGPGEQAPDLVLFPPDSQINVQPSSVTVSKPTPVSGLLGPDMGECHWAACTSNSTFSNSDHIYHTDGVYKDTNNGLFKQTPDGNWKEV